MGDAEEEYADRSLVVRESKNDGRFALWLMPPRLTEGTVTVTATSQNMTLSRKVPFTLDVSAAQMNLMKPHKILFAYQKDTTRPYSFYWQYQSQFGLRGGRHDDSVVYTLPYQPGTSHRVGQGFLGGFTHYARSQEEFAVDFLMDEGTTICAAREGVVILVRADSRVGGADVQKYRNAANYVVIKHSDGTYARYAHLQYAGALVQLGAKVVRGQPIGKSGTTGATTTPHLHFDVSVPIDGMTRRSIPIRFRTSEGIISNPVKGQTYTCVQ